MANCKSCGTWNMESAKFCQNCGHPLSSTTTTSQNNDQTNADVAEIIQRAKKSKETSIIRERIYMTIIGVIISIILSVITGGFGTVVFIPFAYVMWKVWSGHYDNNDV